MLNVWATWCAPCRREMPDFEKIYRKYRDPGLRVIAVNIDRGPDDDRIIDFVKENGITFDIWRDPKNCFEKRFKIMGVPETMLIDRKGVIVYRWKGAMNPTTTENLGLILNFLEPVPQELAKEDEILSKPRNILTAASIRRGKRLMEQRGCFTCHSVDGSSRQGPSVKNLNGTIVELVDGRKVLRDYGYFEGSIRDPDRDIVKGYQAGLMSGAMPGRPLTEIEIEEIIHYLISLSP